MVQIMYMQYNNDNVIVTTLDEFKALGAYAISSLIIRFYTELEQSKKVPITQYFNRSFQHVSCFFFFCYRLCS